MFTVETNNDCPYMDAIKEFLFQEFPTVDVDPEIKFEALSKEVLGTKQRRNGPLPKPEIQVAIRDILRRNKTINFFVPWGASKQDPRHGFDILDLCALRQLESLREMVIRCGWTATFHFRMDDLCDLVLFGQSAKLRISDYTNKMRLLAKHLGPVRSESDFVHENEFQEEVEMLKPFFYGYLTGKVYLSQLKDLGWKGEILPAQRHYYEDQYKFFYPGQDANRKMAEYFAITLTRARLKASAIPPNTDIIQISFANPVPGNPVTPNRVHYRSIPEKYTHIHRPPWNGNGYLLISESDHEHLKIAPKSSGYGEVVQGIVKNTITLDGIEVECDYAVK